MKTLIFSFQSNEASVIEHIAPMYCPIYYVVVVLHACVNECAPMLGFTRFAYPSLKPQSRWVVIIGLELLSLHELVWVWAHYVIYCHPVDLFLRVMRILEIRIWGDRNGNYFWL
jgi:hypothetical protein